MKKARALNASLLSNIVVIDNNKVYSMVTALAEIVVSHCCQIVHIVELLLSSITPLGVNDNNDNNEFLLYLKEKKYPTFYIDYCHDNNGFFGSL